MISRPSWSRRAVLRGMLGGAAVTVGLPFLERQLNSRGDAFADGSLLPTRFGLWMWGNGGLPDRWVPATEGADWEPSLLLQAIWPYRSKLAVLTGLDVRVPNTIPHFSGAAGLLTGRAPLGVEGDNTFASATVDQVIAAEVGGETRFRSLEVGVQPGVGSLSYNGPNSPNPAETSPYALFDRLFGDGFTAPGEEVRIDPKLRLRRSVLDAVAGQATALQSRVGSADRQRLDQHLSGIRDLEVRLQRMEENPPDLAACMRPGAPLEGLDMAQLAERHDVLADLLAMSVACDQTRIFSMFFHGAVSNWLFPGSSAGHHQLTHDELGTQPEVEAITLQIMDVMASFIGKLDAIPEGDGTLLDHCAVLCASEIALGRTHAIDNMPLIVAGSANGALRVGEHIRSAAPGNASEVMLTLIRAMGINKADWGAGDSLATRGYSPLEA
jgi:hypothetical protein